MRQEISRRSGRMRGRMAAASGSRSGQTKKNTTSTSRAKNASGTSAAAKSTAAKNAAAQSAITNEILLIGVFALSVLLFLCNFGVIGPVGDAVSKALFGIFGMIAYVVPVLVFVGLAFGISNRGNFFASMKIGAAAVLVLLIGVVLELIGGAALGMDKYSIVELYQSSSAGKTGGGVLSGTFAYLMNHFLGLVGTVVLVLVLGIISLVIITEKSFVGGVKKQSQRVYESARADAQVRKERAQKRREEEQQMRMQREEEMRIASEQEKASGRTEEKVRRTEKKASDGMKNIVLTPEQEALGTEKKNPVINFDKIRVHMGGSEVKVQPPQEETFSSVITNPEKNNVQERKSFFRGDEAPEKNPEIDPLEETYKDADVFRDMRRITLHKKEIKAKPVSEMVFRDFHQEELPWEQVQPEAGTTVPEEPVTPPAFWMGEETEEAEWKAVPNSAVVEEEEWKSVPYEEEDWKEDPKEEMSEAEFPEEEIIPAPPVRERPKATLPKQGHPSAPDLKSVPTMTAGQKAMAEIRREESAAVSARQAAVKPVKPQKPRPYHYPPMNLLKKIENANQNDAVRELKTTAEKLQQTLESFGVKVTITDISQGPAITRYELQPEVGVKVSKILSLADDIKLNLAATDIRIEAPIPGKAAIGIEVPNKESSMVGLRELLETKDFKEASSRITFAVGKDIAGKVVVHDIAKMPHMLVAGSTGSGKSVCINTLIMSILYKARPDEVKLILIDPKVVELSVYNGIPHLLIPVVTDPKLASSALQWAVAEMTDRYQKFADFSVRDLKGYNKKAAEMKEKGDTTAPDKLPQIVIIVDELADLMMVAPGEVEEYICRLAQLARACGIHLVIATQRPSVDVITGLIKNNMSSRIAFAVTSGVDSRTILDMNGAEKLLGKGDMLFSPQGYPKPARVQGAFVSDDEVSDVVDFLKNKNMNPAYNAEMEAQIARVQQAGSAAGAAEDTDALFADAGRFIIDKDKASIGMLQRVFKIGFNRAARIMDQLARAGVVNEESGTKPRKILMSMEQFENYLEEN